MNSKYILGRFHLLWNRCRCTSAWRWFDRRTVQVGSCSVPSSFGSHGATAVLCVSWEKPIRTRLVLRQRVLFTTFRTFHEPLNLLLPSFYWLRMFMNVAKTQYRIRVSANLCFRQLDCSVVQQSRCHPWQCIPFNRRYSKCFILLIQDQFLRNCEQCFDLSKSVFLVVRRFSR